MPVSVSMSAVNQFQFDVNIEIVRNPPATKSSNEVTDINFQWSKIAPECEQDEFPAFYVYRLQTDNCSAYSLEIRAQGATRSGWCGNQFQMHFITLHKSTAERQMRVFSFYLLVSSLEVGMPLP